MEGAPSARKWATGRPGSRHSVKSTSFNKVFGRAFLEEMVYKAPRWVDKQVELVPQSYVSMALRPTPIHRWHLPGLPANMELYIKRDDLTGMEMSGNKVRKLEFLMHEALSEGHDSVVTIGGIQSNHCRATATAARLLGLEPHLILRTGSHSVAEDPGLVGNLLLDRMLGAHLHLVTKEEYQRIGSAALGHKLVKQLQMEGKRPYLIPVGGSNELGCWGYMQALEEIREQTAGQAPFTHMVAACGSGATLGGLALANALAGYGSKILGYGVCDDEKYFYDFIDGLYRGLGTSVKAQDILTMVQAKGAGYAMSREEELDLCIAVARSTGIVLDPVYSGKAVFQWLQDIQNKPELYRNARVLFVHTGGMLGMFDKAGQLRTSIKALHRVQRLQA